MSSVPTTSAEAGAHLALPIKTKAPLPQRTSTWTDIPDAFTRKPREWGDWEKKFAILPVKINSTGKRVWLRTYYQRWGYGRYLGDQFRSRMRHQNGTIFDVLRTANTS